MSAVVKDPKREEADELRQAIQKMGAFDESLYDKLMISKEKGVIDVLHRVLDDDKERRAHDNTERSLIRRPLHVIIMESFRVIRDILSDLMEAKSIDDFVKVFTRDGRLAYIGVLLMLVSLSIIVFTS